MELNPNEKKLLAFLTDVGTVASIREIAKACGWIKSLGTAKADSRVRNALRRPKRLGLLVKKARGVYELTGKGRATNAVQAPEATVQA